MKITDAIEQLRSTIATKLAERNAAAEELETLRDAETTDEAKVTELRAKKVALDAELDQLAARLKDHEAELAADEAATRLQEQVTPTGTQRDDKPGVVRVGQEPRTYAPDKDRSGAQFLRDVGLSFLGDFSARDRLERHMAEERVERADWFAAGGESRAAGTSAFAGLVVPQYLTDLYAPAARANRPFADACNHHDLPPSGMTLDISRITTSTTAAVQTEGSAVSETNIDDTLLAVSVQTVGGQQTLTRQAIERGTGVEGVMLDDLFRAYATKVDDTLINQATNGLTNVATTVAYTDASPTVAELYPKILSALSGVEGALLDQDPGDNIAVMHSRRWYWMQSAVGTTQAFVSQPGIPALMGFANLAEAYGAGVRGVLPNGTPVIVDNNIGTTLGAGTEDEIFVVSRRECHLWEDPSAPLLIRAEQPAAASLGVLFVVYGYIAYTHARYAQARKIYDTGLIAPTF